MNKMKEKRGSSLLEVIVAVALLAIVVVTVVGGIGLARQSVLDNNVKDDNTAAAQSVTDTLVTYFAAKDSGLTVDQVNADMSRLDSKLLCVKDPSNAAAWDANNAKNKQFWFQHVSEDKTNSQPAGYKVEVRVYYDSGKKYSAFTAFAAYTGGAFQ